jgi:hypothetical protein
MSGTKSQCGVQNNQGTSCLMTRQSARSSFLHVSVEQENLASIPFAVLERRLGKKISKLELQGTKQLPDGTVLNVSWQVQGNSELGLPTEQDLDIFIALGVLTFRNDFAKTVSFSGREIARILGIQAVHGKFYKRLKLAMDRFIPLRFRGISASDRQEDIKWINVFQEASFTLDRDTGRCIGSITWTDKLIDSMNNGFFRVLDAGRYMELDGITAKHLYRFLAVAFERTDLMILDARKLAADHIGILTPPKYLSRLMQTLEPALDQLIRIQVLGSYHIVDTQSWEIALHRHRSYVPERDRLLCEDGAFPLEIGRTSCLKALERAGMPYEAAAQYAQSALNMVDIYQLERAARLIEAMIEHGVMPHVALSLCKKALESGTSMPEGLEMLDMCELAVQVCRDKKTKSQKMRNPAGLLVKMVKDSDSRRRIISEEAEAASRQLFRNREQAIIAQQHEAERRILILEYEKYRDDLGTTIFLELSESARQALRKEKAEFLRQHGRLDRLDSNGREQEIDVLSCQELGRKEAPSFEKWLLRRRARQAVLPLELARSITELPN